MKRIVAVNASPRKDLFEMKIQRNNAYMPTIVFESAEVITDLSDNEQMKVSDKIIISARNIGVGVAKKLY